MHKNRILICSLIFLLSISFTGCAGLQRKFVRKKKKEERIAPVVTTFDYSKDLRVDELYKKHYLFWKTWQAELIERMGVGRKKRVSCYDYTMKHLLDMKKYLGEPKEAELEVIVKEIKSIDPYIRKKILSKNRKYKMTKLLERTFRQIEKRFSYNDVKDFLELKK